jgi:hypothetical protein
LVKARQELVDITVGSAAGDRRSAVTITHGAARCVREGIADVE